MRRKEPYELQKVTLFLREGDFACLQHHYAREGASKRIRDLVIAEVDRLRPPRLVLLREEDFT